MPLALLATMLLCAAVAGCAFSVSPGQKKGHHAEWIGTYQKQKAEERDRNRDTALAVSTALAEDPVLKKLDLRVFVDRGDVRLCGHYPNATTRERAAAVVGALDGVESVTTHCNR